MTKIFSIILMVLDVGASVVYLCNGDYKKAIYWLWSVGDGNGKYGITNNNSISIEMCDSLNWNEEVINRTIPLVKELMAKYNIPISKVVRHYDASRKL